MSFKDPAEILAPFSVAEVRFTIEAIDTIMLQEFKGSALRGGFGHAFRRFACCNIGMDDCGSCPLQLKCVYAYIFETPVPPDDDFLRNRDAAAHPYVIRPPLDRKKKYLPGEELIFDLVLVGRALDYLTYFAQSFIMMGQLGLGRGKGKFILKQMEARHSAGENRLLYCNGDEQLRFPVRPFTCADLLIAARIPGRLTFRFLSPLELKQKGRYPEISFEVLFRSLMRRITSLAHCHNGIDCGKLDFTELNRAAAGIITLRRDMERVEGTRYSSRQKAAMPFGGLIGSVTCQGDFSPFWPFLVLGQWVHVGKKASFGFGRYELVNT